ncbi:MAG: peptidylprolyl isomerase [Bacteroidales bacterium]|nr:peptidylprolyl isomerase [Bacteroidales bacterium]
MNSSIRLTVLFVCLSLISGCSLKKDIAFRAEIKTTEGDIVVILSDLTPLHRDNFIKLSESGFYDGVSFHRIIKDFMIQAGDGTTRVPPSSMAGYTIPAEINDSLFHKRGALAAAREGDDVNPARNSSGTQFYIVQGKTFNDEELSSLEQRIDYNKRQALYQQALTELRAASSNDTVPMTYDEIQQNAILKVYEYMEAAGPYVMPEKRKEIYRTQGGAPFLDGAYTVFGEVVSGMEIVDAIGNTSTDITDKPVKDIRIIKIKILRK